MKNTPSHLAMAIENRERLTRLEVNVGTIRESLNSIDKKIDALNDVDKKLAAHGLYPSGAEENRRMFEVVRVVMGVFSGKKIIALMIAGFAAIVALFSGKG